MFSATTILRFKKQSYLKKNTSRKSGELHKPDFHRSCSQFIERAKYVNSKIEILISYEDSYIS